MELTIPNELSKAIINNKLILFLGAGISINESLPSWKKIVENLLDNQDCDIEKASSFKAALSDDVMSPLEILEKIKKHRKYVLESFEKNLNIENSESEIFKMLGNISKRFITTNFDKLIEQNTNIKLVITQDSSYNLSKVDTNDNYIIKIHGDLDRLDSCIIFEDQYKDLYENDKLATFQLKKLISQYNFLFIGFSFNDPYVNELFQLISNLMDGFGPKHFMVTTNDNKINNIHNIKLDNYSQLKDLIKVLEKVKFDNEKLKKQTVNSQINDITDEDILVEENGSDIAPRVYNWVGRTKELGLLKSDAFKVFFITGIGGEGKSALASHYLEQESNYHLTDWRDFKEEEHKFHYKIYSMIQKVCPSINQNKLVGLSDEQLITLFFKKLGKQKAVFVLDNIDSYIDLENFEPVRSIKKLFDSAIFYEHNSKFIFTCRPFIRYAGLDFHQLKLTGLNEDDTVEYFINEKPSISKEKIIKYAKKSFELTKGHALWLSLIIAHARRGEDTLNEFLHKIENGDAISENDSAIMSKRMLNNIWSSLIERDKLVLRTMAESIVSETAEEYSKMVATELNYNKFQKALKNLQSLNLIIEKRGTDFIELHPLVKEFIRTYYPSTERNKFITMIIQYYDQYVVVLKKRMSYKLSYEDFLNFTNKAELYINASKHQEALNTLIEVMESMVGAGYNEEFLRVVKLFFNSITWTKKKVDEFSNFSMLLTRAITNFIDYGDETYAKELIKKYESIIENKSEEYIKLCSVKTYAYWLLKEYDRAIEISEEALYMMERGELADNFNVKHHYALALRDTKIAENIEKAMKYFLLTNELSKIINPEYLPTKDNGTTYGNVGKCLQLQDKLDDALICYYKSFYFIHTYDNYQRLINLGYASFWIAEILMEKNKEQSYYFFKFAQESWSKSSNVLLNQNQDKLKILTENSTSKSINSQDYWKIEKYCIEFIESKINVKFKI